jgi:RNase P/RNase MRP subunit p30
MNSQNSVFVNVSDKKTAIKRISVKIISIKVASNKKTSDKKVLIKKTKNRIIIKIRKIAEKRIIVSTKDEQIFNF